MKHSFLLAFTVAASLSLFACGDDSSSSPNNVDKDTIESSADNGDDPESSGGKSTDSSSSSEEDGPDSSSSAEDKDGVRAATIDDLQKNMVIKDLFGTDIVFSAGSKKGLFAFFLPGADYDSAWVVVHSDFKKGTIAFNNSNSSYATIGSDGTVKSMKELVTEKASMSFVVKTADEDTTLLCVFKGDTLEVQTTKVKVNTNLITDGTSLKGKRLTCKDNDLTNVFSFFDGSYVKFMVKESDTTHWNAGYYDILRGKFFALTEHTDSSMAMLLTADLSTSYTMTSASGAKSECTEAEFKYTGIDREKIASEWDTVEGDLSWTMNLKDDGTFAIRANEGRDEIRNGEWSVFGDYMVLQSKECSNVACKPEIIGQVTDFDAAKGFTYSHWPSYPKDGKDNGNELPSKWTAAVYE